MKRLSRYGEYELISIKDGTPEKVSEQLLKASENCYRIALDERGAAMTTRELSGLFESFRLDGATKTICFLIGGSDGHTADMRNQCDAVLSLSKLTMQHELALLVLTEQLYRLETIRVGSPYHRD